MSILLVIRRHPDLNWGKRICSPPPYRSAMPPKRYQKKIYEKIIRLSSYLSYCTCILNLNPVFLNSFSKRNLFFVWVGLDPSLRLIV